MKCGNTEHPQCVCSLSKHEWGVSDFFWVHLFPALLLERTMVQIKPESKIPSLPSAVLIFSDCQ